MVRTIRLDEPLWAPASRARRDDWRTTIVDLLDDGRLGHPQHDELQVGLEGTDVSLRLLGGAAATETLTIPSGELAALIGEYLHVIRRMQDEDVSESGTKMQALDMAKKVVHDNGARVLAKAAPGVASTHETYRRLFTLVLSVVVDVTALPGGKAHRRHALA